jgi:glutamine amidotransferase
MSNDVAIIDYNLGNLHSVDSACKFVGLKSKITRDKNEILNSKSAILPGVGAFGEAMNNLKSLNLDNVILDFIDTGKPFIGICLGLQLLFEESDEFGSFKGLGVIKGSVKKFQNNQDKNHKYPVPQIGWNRINKNKNWDNTLLEFNNENDHMYFVHSYYVVPHEEELTLSLSKYGNTTFCSSISIDNIFASQFHPEKSGKKGLSVYKKLKSIC